MRRNDLTALSEENRQTANLLGIVVVLMVVISALVVVRKLQVRAMLEECMMSQQPGCEVSVENLRVSRLTRRLVGD